MTEQERDSARQQGEVIEQAEGAAQQPTRQPAEQADAPAPPTSPAQTTPAEVEGADNLSLRLRHRHGGASLPEA